MKIAAGKWRRRNLSAPGDIRPTSVRVRQAVFDILIRGKFADCVSGAQVLDVFAGSGALALEALSQGAAHATLIDNSPRSIACIESNIATVGATGQTLVIRADATRPPKPPAGQHPASLVLMDPPYSQDVATAALTALDAQDWLASGVTVVQEHDRRNPFTPPIGFQAVDSRPIGPATVAILRRA